MKAIKAYLRILAALWGMAILATLTGCATLALIALGFKILVWVGVCL